MNTTIKGFFYWITAEDQDFVRQNVGPGENLAYRSYQMFATLILCRALAVYKIPYELVDYNSLVVNGTLVRCLMCHPMADTFYVGAEPLPGSYAVVQLDIERHNGRVLGWWTCDKGENRTHISLNDLLDDSEGCFLN